LPSAATDGGVFVREAATSVLTEVDKLADVLEGTTQSATVDTFVHAAHLNFTTVDPPQAVPAQRWGLTFSGFALGRFLQL